MNSALPDIIHQVTGLSPTQVDLHLRSSLEYQNNHLYDIWANGRHLIAKEWTVPDRLHSAPEREFSALTRVASLDIAPRPVFYDPTVAPIVVYEYMDGEMWDRNKPSPQQLAQLADVWLAIHRIEIDESDISASNEDAPVRQRFHRYRHHFQRYQDWAANCFTPGLDVVPYCEELLRKGEAAAQELDKLPPILCFSRADPRFANVIQRPSGRIGLIDWEDSGLRDPAHDAADLITHPNNEDLLTEEEWQAFLQPYLAERSSVDDATVERVHLYTALFPLFWLAALLNWGVKRAENGESIRGSMGNQVPSLEVQQSGKRDLHVGQKKEAWRINGMEPNQRLRRYLARGLAWPNEDFAKELDAVQHMDFFPK